MVGVRCTAERKHTAEMLTEHISLLLPVPVPRGPGQVWLPPKMPPEGPGALGQPVFWKDIPLIQQLIPEYRLGTDESQTGQALGDLVETQNK